MVWDVTSLTKDSKLVTGMFPVINAAQVVRRKEHKKRTTQSSMHLRPMTIDCMVHVEFKISLRNMLSVK